MFQLQNVIVNGILSIKNLTFASSKITCIVGPSGCGKTTLLRLLNQLINPDSGTVFLGDEPLTSIDPITLRRKVVMLQQTPFIFNGTVRDNLLIGLQFSEKEPVSDKELLYFLQLVHLRSELDEDATNLSGGEKQRLALARVLIMKPDILLLDEPTSALDEKTAEDVMKRLVTYVKEISCTVIMISHSKQIVEMVADEVIDISKVNEGVNG